MTHPLPIRTLSATVAKSWMWQSGSDRRAGGDGGPRADADGLVPAMAVQEHEDLREGEVGVFRHEQGRADPRHLLADDDRAGLGGLQLLLVLAVDQEADVALAGLAQGRGRADDRIRISADAPADVLGDLTQRSFSGWNCSSNPSSQPSICHVDRMRQIPYHTRRGPAVNRHCRKTATHLRSTMANPRSSFAGGQKTRLSSTIFCSSGDAFSAKPSGWALEHRDARAERPVDGRIGGAEQGDRPQPDARGEVRHAAVVADEGIGATEQAHHLGQRQMRDAPGHAVNVHLLGGTQPLDLGGSQQEQHLDLGASQGPGDVQEILQVPAFLLSAAAGLDDDESLGQIDAHLLEQFDAAGRGPPRPTRIRTPLGSTAAFSRGRPL